MIPRVTMPPLRLGAGAYFPGHPSKAVLKDFRLRDRFGDEYVLWKDVSGGYLLPRNCAPVPAVEADKRTFGVKPEPWLSKIEPRSEDQARFIKQMGMRLKAGMSFVARAPTGFGKCLGRGTPVVMADGSLRAVEDVQTGDLLLGPDSLPRRVLSTTRGVGPLYRITPRHGEPFVCNDVHVLSLRATPGSAYYEADELVNVELSQYLQLNKTRKHELKAWAVGVELPDQHYQFDPYFVGLYVGDGSRHHSTVTVGDGDPELHLYLKQWATKNGYYLTPQYKPGCTMVSLTVAGSFASRTNPLRDWIQQFHAEKFIPEVYFKGSLKQRLAVLAGLIDADGHLIKKTVFDLVFKGQRLALDTARLARSCGLRAKVRQRADYGGLLGTSFGWRVTISGDTDQVPCLLPRKQATPRRQKKHPLRSGFTVEPLSAGEYFGFELDGDRLFLLGDYTVTHNTVTTIAALAQIQRSVLVIVPKEDLMLQWRKEFERHTTLKLEQIGHVQSDTRRYEGCPVVLGMLASMAMVDYPPEFYTQFGVVVFDEVHRIGADVMTGACWKFPAQVRLGLSATPYRKDGRDSAIEAHIGKVEVVAVSKGLPFRVIRIKSPWKVPRVKMFDPGLDRYVVAPLPHTHGKTMHVEKTMTHHEARNGIIARMVKRGYDKGRHIVVFTSTLAHVAVLIGEFRALGVPGEDIARYVGGVKGRAREQALSKRVIVATWKMLSEGTDIKRLDTAILASPRADVAQAVGRIRREWPGKEDPLVVDIVDADSAVFRDYAHARKKWFLKEQAPIKSFGG